MQELSKSILRLPDQTPSGEVRSIPEEPIELIGVFEELDSLLHRVNTSLRPDKFSILGRSDTQDFIVAVERMKVLVQQLEILRHQRAEERNLIQKSQRCPGGAIKF